MAKMLVNDFQSQNVNYFQDWLDQSGLGKLKVEEFKLTFKLTLKWGI
jgi:hypothetical protein